jgi:hypothetical protein
MTATPFTQFVKVSRAKFGYSNGMLRTVYLSEVGYSSPAATLDTFVADKAPLFYRNPDKIIETLNQGFFTTAIKETLQRLPNSTSFQESHFGEIVATIFAEEVMGLRRIYSKLSLLTSQNSNVYKMDLILYDPNTDPVDIVFGEVKSSPKTSPNGVPVEHDKSCYASLFNSINKYSVSDQEYDLTLARDQVDKLPSPERERVKQALLPYSGAKIRIAGIVVIDNATKHDSEIRVLATRRNPIEFDVDVVGIEQFAKVADSVYTKLETLRKSACSL